MGASREPHADRGLWRGGNGQGRCRDRRPTIDRLWSARPGPVPERHELHDRSLAPPFARHRRLSRRHQKTMADLPPSPPRDARSQPGETGGRDDYELSRPLGPGAGLRQGLTAYGDAHFSLFLRKAFIKALGYSEDALSRPLVGVVNTYSALNPCHANVPQLVDAVRRGVQLAGGLAVDFPTISLHESFASPTSMFLRNLMSMDTEEMIRAQPVDAVVLIGGPSPPAGSQRG